MQTTEIARCMNAIASFTGLRDTPELSRGALAAEGLSDGVADVAVLTGGAILAGADAMAQAMQAELASSYVLVGGTGHTTEAFRARVRELWPAAEFADDASEAEVFDTYLRSRYGLAANLLETRSTNSGNNITFLFELLRANGIEPASLLLVQDETMQRRLDAVVRLKEPQVHVVNYAAYQTKVVAAEAGLNEGSTHGDVPVNRPSARNCSPHKGAGYERDALRQGGICGPESTCQPKDSRTDDASDPNPLHKLSYDHAPFGMWGIDRYLTLLMGEVPRLMDAPGGYGPHGAGLIAHVDIPSEVLAAFGTLRDQFPGYVRTADTRFAGPGTQVPTPHEAI